THRLRGAGVAATPRSRSLGLVAAELTCEDVWAMPDDGYRHELIDGALIVTPAPSWRHQLALGALFALLREHCPPDLRVLVAPVDWVISDTTFVEPDIVVARKADFGPPRPEKPPLLAVEVRSPSTARFDAGTKRLAYEAAGLRWYWLVDPDAPSITVLELVDGSYVER